LFLVISLIVLIFSAKYLVSSAGNVANYFGVSSKLIGVLMAIGTTFPELSVTIQAARKRYMGILVGDLVGSCIVNVILVLGLASTISSIILSNTIFIEIGIMSLLAFLIYLFFTHKTRNQKLLGYGLIGIYILFLIECLAPQAKHCKKLNLPSLIISVSGFLHSLHNTNSFAYSSIF